MHAAHLDDEINQFALFFFGAYAPFSEPLAPWLSGLRAILAGKQETERSAARSGFDERMRIARDVFSS
jgi:hypothetical protein